jgi:hypothetical protein
METWYYSFFNFENIHVESEIDMVGYKIYIIGYEKHSI